MSPTSGDVKTARDILTRAGFPINRCHQRVVTDLLDELLNEEENYLVSNQ